MKELKFRIWDLEEKEWTNYSPQTLCDYKNKIFEFLLSKYQRKNYIIQLYTNFKDKNGFDLYDGDIVSVRLYEDWNDSRGYDAIYQISWCNLHVGWRGFTKKMLDKNNMAGIPLPTPITLIGNIFENPNLLK
jgi:hypothetical protein